MLKSNYNKNNLVNVPVNFFSRTKQPLANPLLWSIFVLYIILAGYTIAHHEMWGDEVHSWNIAKGSIDFFDLINNSRYEGHPPVWYIILWSIGKFTHNLAYVQAVHLVIASLSVFLILFFTPFSLTTRVLIPFGYFFLFEYAILSRNYAIGVLLTICICLIIRKNFRYKLLLYYSLLFLLSSTHLQAMLLAGSLHLYFLLLNNEQKKKRSVMIFHILLGILIAFPAVYFIFPPTDSQLDTQFWMNRWNVHRLTVFMQAPLRAFLPVPSWWNYNFWNTQFLIEAKHNYSIFRYINLLTAIMLLALTIFIFKKNRKSFIFFLTNLILNFIIAVTVIALISERHAGFIYIAFIASYCLYCYETSVSPKIKWLVNGLLIIQLTGGIFAAARDMRYPFSNLGEVGKLLTQIPKNEKAVTDYLTLNAIVAFTDKPFYCIDMQKEISFVLWNKELGETLKKKSRYFEGISNYFQKEGINKVYMVSNGSPQTLLRVDSQLVKSFHLVLIDKIEGSIVKWDNLYLYKISSY